MAYVDTSNCSLYSGLTPPLPDTPTVEADNNQSSDTVKGDTSLREDEALISKADASESSSVQPSTNDTPFPIPLGSLVELRIDFICTTSPTEHNYLREFIDTNGENQQVSVRGRLNLIGGICQRSVANAFIRAEPKHCDNQTCYRLQTDTGDPVNLRFELSPDVVTNPLPQLSLEIHSRRSQKRKLSIWITLKYLLKKLTVGTEYTCSFQLINERERTCGRLNVRFRGGMQTDLENNGHTWTVVAHESKPCILTVKISDLQAAGSEDKDAHCLANIWSSTIRKIRSQMISSLLWKFGGAATENGQTKGVPLQVTDADTEVFCVGIYRYSTHERNELIGLGSFSIYSLQFPTDAQPAEQCVRLYPESASTENECGLAILTLQTTCVPQESEVNTNISFAANGLSSVAYPVPSGEMKCRFDIDILEVQTLPSNVSEGDSISILLRIAQNNWKAELGPAKVVSTEGSKTLVPVGGDAHTVICWAAKDRSFPVLEIFVYLQRQRQPIRIGMSSRASLSTTSNLKRRQNRQTSKGTQRTSETLAPVLMATGSLNLSSFFSQQNTSVFADLQLDLEQEFVDNDSTRGNVASVLSKVRASSSQENNASSFGFSSQVAQPVKGDVCIHLLQANGSAFRKSNSLSTYCVSISSGPEEVMSSWCSIDDTNILTWNQHLAIPVACTGSPVIQLALYHRAIDAASTQQEVQSQRLDGDQIIGYLTLPIFPSVLADDHLLQLELPFGMPLDPARNDANKQRTDLHYYKRGILTLEMQFLPSEQPKSSPLESSDVYELVIHRVRGNLQDSGTPQISSRLAKHVFIEISITADRGGTGEELAVGATGVISLSQSGLTEVGEVVDLSNPILATTLLNGTNNILIGRIRDLIGNNYGRVHLPLRKDWKERLVKQVWYPICVEADNTVVTTTKDAVLMSLQARPQNNSLSQSNELGKFHVNVCETILVSGFDSLNLMKLGKYGGASVQMEYTSTDDSIGTKRSRTRQTTDQNSSHHWCWENEWFVFSHTDELTAPQDLRFSLQIGVQSNHPRLNGRLNLSSIIEDAKLRRLDTWIPLHDESTSDNDTASAHLHVVVVYFPTIIGTINMNFGESYTFSESERMLHVENIFYKCKTGETSYSSTIVPADTFESSTTDEIGISSGKQLRLPLDTRLDTSTGIPELFIQRMGVTKSLGEICLGVLTMNLLSISDLCSLTSSGAEVRDRFTWCKFTDKSDRSKTTGVTKLHVTFGPGQNLAEMRRTTGTTKMHEERVASAEMFTIWKKLFYLLDENGNGYIDRKEFTSIFMDHLNDMLESSDGQKLLQLLFGDDNTSNQDSTIVPTQQQITALFAMMDTNRDNEIEWSEYLRFLQQRQQQLLATSKENDENPATNTPEVASTQKRELRKKKREDRCTALSSSSDQLAAQSNQDEMLAGNRDVKSRSDVLKQAPASPKRSNKVSRSEEKLLKLQYSNQEQSRLQQQITSLETILAIERRRYAELAADRQALMRSYQQLHLKHQNEIIQEQTKAKWMKQTIERQQQQLEEREVLRQNRNQASIVLQSTVRSRLEQKRYQGLKLQRTHAAIAIQCMVRRVKAKKQLQVLQELDRVAKLRTRSASRIQRFIRFHLYRKERAFLVEARKLSATILQKNARRMIAGSVWRSQKVAILKLQCWVRQRHATKHLKQLQSATLIVKIAVLGWFSRWQYTRIQTSTRKLQRWWRRASKERSKYVEQFEAALCIQSAWKRRITRKWFEREWQRQDKFLSELEAAICIQAAWRGRQQRLLPIRSHESSPRFEDDSVIEARLYDIVAIIEADAVASTSENKFTSANSISDDLCESPSMKLLEGDDANELPKLTKDQQFKFKPKDEHPIGDDAEIFSVLKNVVDIVVNIGDTDVLKRENVYGTAKAEVKTNPRGIKDLSDLKVIDHATQDFESEKLEEAEAEVEEERTAAPIVDDNITDNSTDQPAAQNHVLDSDDSDLSIIQNLLEDIKALVADEDTAEAEHTTPSVNEDTQQDSSQSRSNDFSISAAAHEQFADEGHAVDSLQEADVSGDQMQLVPSNDVAQEEVIDTESGAVPAPVTDTVDTTSDERLVVDHPNEGGGDLDSELVPTLFEESEQAVVLKAAQEFAIDADNKSPNGTDTSDNEARHNDIVEANVERKHDDGVNVLSSATSADNDTAFDTDTAVGDFTMPNDSDSDENNDSDDDDTGGSSMDSTDLMMEADAMAIIDASNSDTSKVTETSARSRKTTRLDSSILLADVDRLNAQENSDSGAT